MPMAEFEQVDGDRAEMFAIAPSLTSVEVYCSHGVGDENKAIWVSLNRFQVVGVVAILQEWLRVYKE